MIRETIGNDISVLMYLITDLEAYKNRNIERNLYTTSEYNLFQSIANAIDEYSNAEDE